MNKPLVFCGILVGLSAGIATAQVTPVAPARPDQAGIVPLYKVSVVGRTATAVNFHVLGGKTSLDLRGTVLLPTAQGKAEVKIERGATHIHVDVKKMAEAKYLGPEYLTYVMWAITPDGRTVNLGEIQLDGSTANMDVTTTLQDFGLIVTAEPYFGVSRPSDLVVMEAHVTPGTVGATSEVQANYKLLERGQYRLHVDASKITPLNLNPKVPLDLYEAQNAVRIANWAGAQQYAGATYEKAVAQLQQAENYEDRNAGRAPVATVARQAVQTAEDARLLTLKNREQEQVAAAKAAADAQAANAQAEAAAAQRRAADAQAAQQQAEAEKQAATANMAAANVARESADAAREQAEQQAAAARAQAHAERVQLLSELNSVLATRDSATGLIVSMPDVLFDLNKATLHPDAQVKLAKVAGILLSFPDLKVQVNGYTDSTGTVDYNQQLSEQRAVAVKDFLASQGVSPNAISSQGFGEADPVAPNISASGRQENRRVELVVNGAAIGTALGANHPQP